jgi:hypothetical protein
VAAGLHPPFHDRIHTRHPYASEHGRDPGVGEDPVEQGRELRVPVTDQILDPGACLVQVHHEIPGDLAHPGSCRVRGGAEDTDPAGGVLDHGQDVLTLPGQGDRLDEVDGQERLGLAA